MLYHYGYTVHPLPSGGGVCVHAVKPSGPMVQRFGHTGSSRLTHLYNIIYVLVILSALRPNATYYNGVCVCEFDKGYIAVCCL